MAVDSIHLGSSTSPTFESEANCLTDDVDLGDDSRDPIGNRALRTKGRNISLP